MKNKDYFGIELDTDKLKKEADIIDKAKRGELEYGTLDLILSIQRDIHLALSKSKLKLKENND